MSDHTYPIVGAHFRPPAKGLLAVLPKDFPLYAVPEPDNQYDVNAIKVVLNVRNLVEEEDLLLAIEEAIAPFGFSLDEFTNVEEWHLGYIPKNIAAVIVDRFPQAGLPGKMSFDLKGGPAIQVDYSSDVD